MRTVIMAMSGIEIIIIVDRISAYDSYGITYVFYVHALHNCRYPVSVIGTKLGNASYSKYTAVG